MSKDRGTIAETAAATALLHEGFGISFAHGDNLGWDICTDWKGKVNRIQVKTASKRTGNRAQSYSVSFRHGSAKNVLYTKTDCDFILVFLSFGEDYASFRGNGIYIIPVGAITVSTGLFWPPGLGSKGPDKICAWEKYRDKFNLLK
tara:strand:- start:212 stop:649 length:438 start_codon:yes stop_codon:yes gene_type:complete